MATITYDQSAPGRGANVEAKFFGTRVEKLISGKFSFDSSYPTGGEDISEIFGLFRQLLGIWIEDPTDSTGTGLKVVIDYTGKKALLFDNAANPAEVADTSDQSNAASLRFLGWGF